MIPSRNIDGKRKKISQEKSFLKKVIVQLSVKLDPDLLKMGYGEVKLRTNENKFAVRPLVPRPCHHTTSNKTTKMLGEDSSNIITMVYVLSYFSGRLHNHSSSNKITTKNSSVNFLLRARLHLIVQIPVLNITNEQENSSVVLRQKEYIYCLRRNLNSPHVS